MSILLFLTLAIFQINLEDNPAKHSISECKTIVFQPAKASDASRWPQRITTGKTYFAVAKNEVYTTFLPRGRFRKIMSIILSTGKMASREESNSAGGYVFWCEDSWVPGVIIKRVYPVDIPGVKIKQLPVEALSNLLDTGFPITSIKRDDMLRIAKEIRLEFRRSALPIPAYIPTLYQEGNISPKSPTEN